MSEREAPLTYVEFEILSALARSPGRVFTRDMLLARIWGDSAYRDPRTIDVHIRHLREKIEPDPKEPEYLFTVLMPMRDPVSMWAPCTIALCPRLARVLQYGRHARVGVQTAEVLDVALLADDDLLVVAAEDGAVPDIGRAPQSHPADHDGAGRHPGLRMDVGFVLAQRAMEEVSHSDRV